MRRWLALSIALAGGMPVLAAPPAMGWRDAYQSSPRASLTEAQFRELVERMKIPPPIAEKIKPQPVTGTLRYRIAVSAAGNSVRLRFSNEEGTAPVVISAASVGLAGDGFDAGGGGLIPVTFSGRKGIAIPAGAPVVSDPIAIGVANGSQVLVSYKVEGTLLLDGNGGSPVALAPGDQTMATHMSETRLTTGRPELTGISVATVRKTGVVVALGDSITDGNRPSLTALHSWPEELAHRLAGGDSAVVNAGIAGNRVLANGMGLAALTRLDRDVLRIEGLSHIILLEGTNDIGMSGASSFGANPALAPEDLIAGYRQIIARAHDRGVTVIIGTITPFGGSMSHFSPEHESLRQAVNRWIRSSGEPDGVIDFDAALRDPAQPAQLRADYDSGDHLHPNEAGSKAMGDAVPLAIFRKRGASPE